MLHWPDARSVAVVCGLGWGVSVVYVGLLYVRKIELLAALDDVIVQSRAVQDRVKELIPQVTAMQERNKQMTEVLATLRTYRTDAGLAEGGEEIRMAGDLALTQALAILDERHAANTAVLAWLAAMPDEDPDLPDPRAGGDPEDHPADEHKKRKMGQRDA